MAGCRWLKHAHAHPHPHPSSCIHIQHPASIWQLSRHFNEQITGEPPPPDSVASYMGMKLTNFTGQMQMSGG